jgi:hypothetical protein
MVDEDSKFFQYVGKRLPIYTALQTIRIYFSFLKVIDFYLMSYGPISILGTINLLGEVLKFDWSYVQSRGYIDPTNTSINLPHIF